MAVCAGRLDQAAVGGDVDGLRFDGEFVGGDNARDIAVAVIAHRGGAGGLDGDAARGNRRNPAGAARHVLVDVDVAIVETTANWPPLEIEPVLFSVSRPSVTIAMLLA